MGFQYRPDDPRTVRGKIVKYETPPGQTNGIDVPPGVLPVLGDPNVSLLLTEGPIKADSAWSAGLPCVALLGVWNWRHTNTKGGKVALPDFETIALNDERRMVLAFDSDAHTNANVHAAMRRLAALLASRGAEVLFLYLPPGEHGVKQGLDDYLGAGHTTEEVWGRVSDELREIGGEYTSPRHSRTRAQAAPEWAADEALLDRFAVAVSGAGLVGERTTAQLLYLAFTSRLLDKPVSVGIKGLSSSGKSFVAEVVGGFFPDEAVLKFTAMSGRALIYNDDDYRHRMILFYEAEGLREGAEEDWTAYFVRTLLSEGRIDYPVTVRDPATGKFTVQHVTKEGPTGLIFTTTRANVHPENETRVLTVTSDDSTQQTKNVLRALADERPAPSLDDWVQLQLWLQDNVAGVQVTIPYSDALAQLIPPVAVRLRRDFAQVLSLIRAHALLHEGSRLRNDEGLVVATFNDYEVVRELVAPLVAEGVNATVSAATRETVEAVAELNSDTPTGVTVKAVATRLGLDRSNVSRRMTVAARGGWVINLEDRRGKPGRWAPGDPLPEAVELLPSVALLRTCAQASATAEEDIPAGQGADEEGVCAGARMPGGGRDASRIDLDAEEP
jgi:hypothetical protein